MISRSLGQITPMVNGTASRSLSPDIVINGVSTDSRTTGAGHLFIPLDIGGQFDGHDYVLEAFAKGAIAALWQRNRVKPDGAETLPLIEVDDTTIALQMLAASYLQTLPTRVIGITGSNGKTSTKDMVAAVLASKYKVHKTAGNLNNHIGLPLTILQLDESFDFVVLEMGMRGLGEISILTHIAKPDVAIITNIGEAHLELLGSREGIAKAKTEIVEGLKENGLFIYHGDEPLIDQVIPGISTSKAYQTIRFGHGDTNELVPTQIESSSRGTSFRLNLPDTPSFWIPALGAHNVTNAMAAIAVGRHFGLTYEQIKLGLANFELTGMRIELTEGPNRLTLLNDAYNASPASTRAAIRLLEALDGYTRKFVVLGDMLELGMQEVEYHRQIGYELNPERIDAVFTYGKLAAHIADAAKDAYNSELVYTYDDKIELIAKLNSLLRPGDIVLVKGSRGMRMEEVIQALLKGNDYDRS